MKKILFGITGGLPLTQDHFDYFQEAVIDQIGVTAQGFAKEIGSANVPVIILNGFEWSGNIFNSGHVLIDGKVYLVGSSGYSTQPKHWIKVNESFDATGNTVNSNGDAIQTRAIETAIIEHGTVVPSGAYEFTYDNEKARLSFPYFTDLLLNKMHSISLADSLNEKSSKWKKFHDPGGLNSQDISLNASLISSSDANCDYLYVRKKYDNTVEFTGQLKPNYIGTQDIDGIVAFTLPEDLRPNSDYHTMITAYTLNTGQTGYYATNNPIKLTILTNGNAVLNTFDGWELADYFYLDFSNVNFEISKSIYNASVDTTSQFPPV